MSKNSCFEFYRDDVNFFKVTVPESAVHFPDDMPEEKKQSLILKAAMSAVHLSNQKLMVGDVIHLNGVKTRVVTEELLKELNVVMDSITDAHGSKSSALEKIWRRNSYYDLDHFGEITSLSRRAIMAAYGGTDEMTNEDDQINEFFSKLVDRINSVSLDEKANILKSLPKELRKYILDDTTPIFDENENLQQQQAEYETWRQDIMDAPEVK